MRLKNPLELCQKTYDAEDISIIMPVYNHEDTLAEAIESALMQEMPYTSIIYCLNDASTDNSATILNEYEKKYPNKIKVFTSTTNQGSGKKSFLHNRPPVNGKYWCLLAGDDFWLSPKKLHNQIAFLENNANYVGCSCNSTIKNENTGEISLISPDKDNWNILDLLLLKHKYAFYVHTTSIVWRNAFLDQGFFLPPEFLKDYAYGDVVLGHIMLSKGGLMHNISEVMSCYRVTGRGVWTSKSTAEQDEINAKLEKSLWQATPIKYKFFSCLYRRFPMLHVFSKFIPSPVNG